MGRGFGGESVPLEGPQPWIKDGAGHDGGPSPDRQSRAAVLVDRPAPEVQLPAPRSDAPTILVDGVTDCGHAPDTWVNGLHAPAIAGGSRIAGRSA